MNSIIVFDIETIPDVGLCQALTGFKGPGLKEQREAMEQYHLEITEGKNPFLRQPFHKIIVISMLKASLTIKNGYECLELKKISSGSLDKLTEKELVEFFFNYICKCLPRLISFNGKTFDLPVLKYKAMHYGIMAEKFYKAGDKWNSYNNRYSVDWHCDLLEVLSEYGASARVKMCEVCTAFNLPGKLGIDGSNVAKMYDDNQLLEVKNYCETDVLNTYLIYLRLSLHQGKISKEGYQQNIEELINYIKENPQQNKSFPLFLTEWEKVCKGNFFYAS